MLDLDLHSQKVQAKVLYHVLSEKYMAKNERNNLFIKAKCSLFIRLPETSNLIPWQRGLLRWVQSVSHLVSQSVSEKLLHQLARFISRNKLFIEWVDYCEPAYQSGGLSPSVSRACTYTIRSSVSRTTCCPIYRSLDNEAIETKSLKLEKTYSEVYRGSLSICKQELLWMYGLEKEREV